MDGGQRCEEDFLNIFMSDSCDYSDSCDLSKLILNGFYFAMKQN